MATASERADEVTHLDAAGREPSPHENACLALGSHHVSEFPRRATTDRVSTGLSVPSILYLSLFSIALNNSLHCCETCEAIMRAA